MTSIDYPLQHIVTLPPSMAGAFERLQGHRYPTWFATCDPPGSSLGSGGGTANALADAWRHTASGQPFLEWLGSSRKLIVHGDGQSRRLPAYATVGKPLMPVPVLRWSRGQRLDQTLLDLATPDYERVLEHAPAGFVAMVTAGDVLLRFGPDLPELPDVDVLAMGMWGKPQIAKDHGVFFCPRERPEDLAFVLQKPSHQRLQGLIEDYVQLVDTGMWLLSERAVMALMRRTGWRQDGFVGDRAEGYELYGQMGLALGTEPTTPDPALGELTSAVVALPDAEFHHLGTSRALIESATALQNAEVDETKLGVGGTRLDPSTHNLSSRVDAILDPRRNHSLWVENSVVPASWDLADSHVLTGIPDNTWDLHLRTGTCVDFSPVGEEAWCVRMYGIDDAFAGNLEDGSTAWLGASALDWFEARGISWSEAGVDPSVDIQSAELFPVLEPSQLDSRFLAWLLAERPADSLDLSVRWCKARRLSASGIANMTNLDRALHDRRRMSLASLERMLGNAEHSVFFRLDLDAAARLYAQGDGPIPGAEPEAGQLVDSLDVVHHEMFRSAVLRHRGAPEWQGHEVQAFAHLRQLITSDTRLSPSTPQSAVLGDQIVWGRSPVRLDLAGGWTDTPPYCLEYGGRVLNVAVDLNGQPPIQVFAKLSPRPEIVLRSIDLGVEERVRTWEELEAFGQPGSEFGLAKAGLALAGFLPPFHAQPSFGSLAEQLEDFGGGIELSMLSAVPKGSGLGTSSVLAATLMATLSELCGLGWDRMVLFDRTLALEQLLTTGGGWQDQAGGLFPGLKRIDTSPGLRQRPALRWLPERLLGPDHANRTVLLYYTGLTRLAKDILHEIVRGLFLNDPARLRTLHEIGANAVTASDAIQRHDYTDLARAIDRAWVLNQRLDTETNTAKVQAILDAVSSDVAGAKLLGAGGGGYLLLLAHDEEAARRIRRTLEAEPPNRLARFVDFSVSQTGLQVTRS